MSDMLQSFDALLVKFRFKRSVPDEAKALIREHRFTSYKKTLRAINRYSWFYGMVLALYYIARKGGLKAPLIASKIAAGVTVAAIATSSTAVMYQKVLKPVLEKRSDEKSAEKGGMAARRDTAGTFVQKPATTGMPAVSVVVHPFEAYGVEPDAARRLEDLLYTGLAARRAGMVIRDRERPSAAPGYIITGRIVRLGRNTSCTVKVLGAADGAIAYSQTFIYTNDRDMESGGRKIIDEIAAIPTLWQQRQPAKK
jgi:hypothetical protein